MNYGTKARRKAAYRILAHAVLIILCALTFLPIWYALRVSFGGENTLVSSSLSFFPEKPTLDNYRSILLSSDFVFWIRNSFLLSASSVVFALCVSVPAAYAFSRRTFRGKNLLLWMFLVLNAFPTVLSIVAVYRLFRLLHLMNTYLGLVVIYTGMMVIFGIWNMKGYFDTLPYSIEEAAMIDGASPLQVLLHVVLPMSIPAIVVSGTLIFITSWNEYIYAINFLADRGKFTLAAGLYSLQGTEFTRNWPRFTAGAIVVTIPVLALFFAAQRFMVSGLSSGGSKF